MYRNTRFSKILKGLPRSVFEKHAQQLGADKHCKGFRAWDQLIALKGLGYDDWTRDNHSSRTQGLKVHVLMTSDTCTPLESIITAPNVTDIEIGRQIPVEKGQTYVFDKRSEERRVGKECRSRWSQYYYKKK